MKNTTSAKFEEFDRFMEIVARMTGVSRKKLDRIMFQGREVPRVKRSRPAERPNASSRLAVR
jgi:hypothetical protein